MPMGWPFMNTCAQVKRRCEGCSYTSQSEIDKQQQRAGKFGTELTCPVSLPWSLRCASASSKVDLPARGRRGKAAQAAEPPLSSSILGSTLKLHFSKLVMMSCVALVSEPCVRKQKEWVEPDLHQRGLLGRTSRQAQPPPRRAAGSVSACG